MCLAYDVKARLMDPILEKVHLRKDAKKDSSIKAFLICGEKRVLLEPTQTVKKTMNGDHLVDGVLIDPVGAGTFTVRHGRLRRARSDNAQSLIERIRH